jgi:hypothetical protein
VEHSKHPELEPRCFLVYLYMTPEERKEDDLRRNKHLFFIVKGATDETIN